MNFHHVIAGGGAGGKEGDTVRVPHYPSPLFEEGFGVLLELARCATLCFLDGYGFGVLRAAETVGVIAHYSVSVTGGNVLS